MLFVRLECGEHFLCSHTRRQAGGREIDQRRIDANYHNVLLGRAQEPKYRKTLIVSDRPVLFSSAALGGISEPFASGQSPRIYGRAKRGADSGYLTGKGE